MKRILSILAFLLSGSILTQAQNNCTIQAINITAAASGTYDVGGNCQTHINVNFDILHNDGAKWISLYFYDGFNPYVNGGTPKSTDPLLPGAFALLGIDNSGVVSIQSQSVNGIAPQTSYIFNYTPITGGTRISISGLIFTKSGPCSTSEIFLYAAATNKDKPEIQCYGSNSFMAYQVFVSGKIDCSGPRNYDLVINTDFKINAAPAPLSGKYDVYVDLDNDGIVDAGETQITNKASFATIVDGSSNRFTIFDNNYSFPPGDARTSANLIVVVTPDVGNVAPVSGRLVNSCGTLPVTLKNFNAKLSNNAVALTWETADEINNKGFEIQRRFNGEATYQKIAFVEAKATQGLGASYSFTDANARNKGSVSYRLAQADVDGKISLSEIRIVNTGAGNSQIVVYPNPSKGTVKVSLPTQLSKADISLEDFSGKTIQRWNAYASNILQIDQIRPGIYLIRVRLQETGEQMIERLIVQ